MCEQLPSPPYPAVSRPRPPALPDDLGICPTGAGGELGESGRMADPRHWPAMVGQEKRDPGSARAWVHVQTCARCSLPCPDAVMQLLPGHLPACAASRQGQAALGKG